VDSTSWRESDVAGIARNFYREGMNILYPRIDWRGDGPGFVEMEFPLFPWLAAVLYKAFGPYEILGRVLAFSFSIAAFFFFYKLATLLLPEFARNIALLFFAMSPLPIHIAATFQPDGLMYAAYLCAAYGFLRWIEEGSASSYWLALGALTLAILAKAPAAHLLLFFGLASLHRMGLAALRSGKLWLLALLSLLPSALWYKHAYSVWIDFGNSLGLSNVEHVAGSTLLRDPALILGIAKQEYLFVWMETGVLAAAAAVVFQFRSKAVRYCALWLVAVGVFYLVAAPTASSLWARYYHVVAVPPAALLFGLGVDALRRLATRGQQQRIVAAAAAALAVGVVIARRLGLVGALRESGLARLPDSLVWFLAFAAASLMLLGFVWRKSETSELWAAYFFFFVIFATLGFELHQVSYIYIGHSSAESYDCVRDSFGPARPPESLIVASGGGCSPPFGRRSAHNASYMFYWLDRKGFNLCVEEQSVAVLAEFARRGATHFVGEEWALAYRPEFRKELERFERIGSCGGAALYDLGVSHAP
jgi:hypothetical protein